MTRAAIVCDSTCDLGPESLSGLHVVMVPLRVRFGDDTYLDWVEMTPDAFYERLVSSPVLPKTSQPSPADFSAAYERLAGEGVEEIVSIHLSSALSGTVESATLAATTAPVPVRVIDTRLVSQAAGLVVKAAVHARESGGDAAAIEEAALAVAASCRLFFILNTLDYLVKGGRAGKAAGLAVALLNIKPVLSIRSPEGIVEPFKKVKGTKRAVSELVAHVRADTAGRRFRMRLLHANALPLAEELRDAVLTAGCDCDIDGIGDVGAVIGTYAGPGAIGLAYHPV